MCVTCDGCEALESDFVVVEVGGRHRETQLQTLHRLPLA